MMKKMLYLGMIILSLALTVPVQFAVAAEQGVITAQSPVNINTATLAELEVLPGIGPVSAQRIIDYRSERGPFSTIDQLVEVKGIGDKSLEKLRPLVSTN
ncbi:ComEA family DNA-binding protein [Trichloromonas sp.]|uniref:ComEA family DNA-binding protein n=1 Tax=Trichloromonas sp. TaxID=3069249 RepID=UPI003D8132F6